MEERDKVGYEQAGSLLCPWTKVAEAFLFRILTQTQGKLPTSSQVL